MRDLLVLAAIAIPLWYALRQPWIGVAVWTMVSLLNPHRFTWGFAYNMPVAAAAAGVTFIGLVLTKDPRRAPNSPQAILMIFLSVWICITTAAAFFPEASVTMLSRVLKIYLMTVVAMCVIVTERHIKVMMWVMTLSIALISAKGGMFTLMTGGNYRVWGPPDSFIEDNNSFAVAAVMIVPMLAFLATQAANKWLKRGLLLAMPLSLMSALGSHSRGALLAMSGMLVFFVFKTKRKFLALVLIIAALPVAINFLPHEWFTRMETLETYQEDSSAMGRINAWHNAWNVATDRVTGAGFAIANAYVFTRYAPNPDEPLTAHSIYFQMMGEHGFIGLLLFLALWFVTWMQAGWVVREAPRTPDSEWMAYLARMLQVSMIGYLVGGAFLSLAYWDMPYYVAVIVVAMRRLVQERQAGGQLTRQALVTLTPAQRRLRNAMTKTI